MHKPYRIPLDNTLYNPLSGVQTITHMRPRRPKALCGGNWCLGFLGLIIKTHLFIGVVYRSIIGDIKGDTKSSDYIGLLPLQQTP